MTTAVTRLVGVFLLLVAQSSLAMEEWQFEAGIRAEDYGLYDRIVTDKFLTSQTQLVMLERMMVSRLEPKQDESMTMSFFQRQGYFDEMLPQDLARDFIGVNQRRTRLEGRFQFGVRYRFVSEDSTEESEAHAALRVVNDHTVRVQTASVLDRLAFSRVGRTPKNDQALVYVENVCRDGTGAGFLVWFRRRGHEWEVFDTEIVWAFQSR